MHAAPLHAADHELAAVEEAERVVSCVADEPFVMRELDLHGVLSRRSKRSWGSAASPASYLAQQ